MPNQLTTPIYAALCGLLVGVPQAARAQDSIFPVVHIAGEVSLAEVRAADDGIFIYRYRASNASGSDVGISAVGVDVGAPLGQRGLLEGSGDFLGDGTWAEGATAGHVPIGMDSPGEWTGNITPHGFAEWYTAGPGLDVTDSIAPGAQRDDFALRSRHLPAVRKFWLLPHYPYLCCPYPAGDPLNEGLDVKFPEDFRAEGLTVGPTHAPEAMSLEVLRSQLVQVCGLKWIREPGICRSLAAKLEAAARSLERGAAAAARDPLQSFVQELEAQHGPEPGKHVNDDAYWLLRTNAEFLLSRL